MPEKPSTLTSLRPEDVHAYVARTCFKTGPPGRLGVELEWLVVDPTDPTAPVPLTRTQNAAESALPLPNGSALTYEPGGQLELSSVPAPDLETCWRSVREDVAAITDALMRHGLRLLGSGLDPVRPPVRQRHTPRYDAMAHYFAAQSSAGRAAAPWMMCSSAAVQVCIDVGADLADARERWELANALTPVLAAMFANSPTREGRDTGWRSTRLAVWGDLDPSRTRTPVGADPVSAWASYALDAGVLAIPDAEGGSGPWIVDPGMTLAGWLTDAGRTVRPVTEDDVEFHLSTLFPPVRPRSWVEVRTIDAQHGEDWVIPVAVVSALVDGGGSAYDGLRDVLARVGDRTTIAARDGLGDPLLADAAARCMTAALDVLTRRPDRELLARVCDFAERYTFRGRCPADDVAVVDFASQWVPA